mmetsp:Transcript_54551/g.168912  ORF Transcript_54551/g.168912 Transcript_54551/m.168912 type:complete len:258 (-) Transcript_54551:361-1134(-)
MHCRVSLACTAFGSAGLSRSRGSAAGRPAAASACSGGPSFGPCGCSSSSSSSSRSQRLAAWRSNGQSGLAGSSGSAGPPALGVAVAAAAPAWPEASASASRSARRRRSPASSSESQALKVSRSTSSARSSGCSVRPVGWRRPRRRGEPRPRHGPATPESQESSRGSPEPGGPQRGSLEAAEQLEAMSQVSLSESASVEPSRVGRAEPMVSWTLMESKGSRGRMGLPVGANSTAGASETLGGHPTTQGPGPWQPLGGP